MHTGPICQEQQGNRSTVSIFNTPTTFQPIVITSNLWIFVSTPTTQGSAITIICPDKATSSLPFQQPLHILKLPPSCSATSRHFHLPQYYDNNVMTIHVSLRRATLNSFNISVQDFHVWQHIGSNWSTTHIQKLVNVPEIPVTLLFRHLIGQSKPFLPFEMNRCSEEVGPFLIGTFLTHPGTYIGYPCTKLIASMGIYCLKKLWCRPASPRHVPYTPLWKMM